MVRPAPTRKAALVFVAGALVLSAILMVEEYETLHGSARFRNLLEVQVWITVAMMAALGVLGLIAGVLSRRRKSGERC